MKSTSVVSGISSELISERVLKVFECTLYYAPESIEIISGDNSDCFGRVVFDEAGFKEQYATPELERAFKQQMMNQWVKTDWLETLKAEMEYQMQETLDFDGAVIKPNEKFFEIDYEIYL